MSYFLDLAESGYPKVAKSGFDPAILFIDLEGMKFFNRKFGFAEGNRLLKAFSAVLAKTFGKDMCCRISGDHFGVLSKAENLEETLQKFFEECKQLNGGNSLPVRVGIYLLSMDPVPAAIACDRAKMASDAIRNTSESKFNYYDRALNDILEHRQYIIENFDRALKEKWIKVYYQAIVRAVNGRVCDEEALSRWFDPQKGMLSPDEFIPILEDSGQIYKLDLYVLDTILEKIKLMSDLGFDVVPQSVNLSRSDFEVCDMVEEVRSRVDAAGITRSLITIEITESTLGSNFDYIKEQIRRFKSLGFPVWMDDFGSGYSSLDILQSVEFDLIKFDKKFMDEFGKDKKGKIILGELMRMATALGLDTVCEGVETAAQKQFLKDIGCSKLQGYYYTKPLPLETILKRYETGMQIGFENTGESEYHETVGRANLYDLSGIPAETEHEFEKVYDMIPMAVLEVDGERINLCRSNSSYREFLKRRFSAQIKEGDTDFTNAPEGDGAAFMNMVRECSRTGQRVFFDEHLSDGSTIHSFASRLASNPVTGVTAVRIAVLSISDAQSGMTYVEIARALAEDYYNIYYVDLNNESFIEYSSVIGGDGMSIERHGEHFFDSVKADSSRIFEADRDMFLSSFTRENVLRELDKQGVFVITYRLVDSGEPVYVSMKVVRARPDRMHIVIGVSIIDSQMKEKKALERLQSEQLFFNRAIALSGNFMTLYTVNPVTDKFIEYNSSAEYRKLGLLKNGDDFFGLCVSNGIKVVYPEDLDYYLKNIAKDNILRVIEENGRFAMEYRLMIGETVFPVRLTAALVNESDGEKLIVGISHREVADKKPGIDYRNFVNSVAFPCCVISVQKKEGKKYGDIRIVCANEAYKNVMGPAYYDNMLYHELVPQDNKFEDYVYRAAVLHQKMHAYVETRALSCWTDQTMIPLESDDENFGYCQFIFEFTNDFDADRMSAVSVNTAEVLVRIVSKISSSKNFNESVEYVMDLLLETCEAGAGRIMLFDHERKDALIYCERFRGSIPEVRNRKDIISYDLMLGWEKVVGESNDVIIQDEHDMEELKRLQPEWAKSLIENSVTSLVLIPLRRNNTIIGYLYIVNYNIEKTVEAKEISELLSFVLGAEISNHQLMLRLERQSRVDALTAAQNRRAMDLRIDHIKKFHFGLPFGVVNIDLNGLKTVNDNRGHVAGDLLLIKAAGLLRRVFDAEDIFRTGGDEFVVITDGIDEPGFLRKLSLLDSYAASSPEISFSIGTFWSDGSVGIDEAIRTADDIMYENKLQYYETHPGKMRR